MSFPEIIRCSAQSLPCSASFLVLITLNISLTLKNLKIILQFQSSSENTLFLLYLFACTFCKVLGVSPTHNVHAPSQCSLLFHRPGYSTIKGTLTTFMAYSRQNLLRTCRYSSAFCSGLVPKACGSPSSHSPVLPKVSLACSTNALISLHCLCCCEETGVWVEPLSLR